MHIDFTFLSKQILGKPLSTPGAPKKQQKVDESPPSLAHAREGLKTFVAKSLRKLLGAQFIKRVRPVG